LKIADAAIEKRKLIQIKDLYFDMVVHDLKNPLQCISGALEILSETVKDKTMIQSKLFETAENGVKQIFTMVSNMLGVSSFEKGTIVSRKEKFNLKESIVSEMKMFQQVKMTFAPDFPDIVNVDKELFFRVLTNIVGNAQRFSLQDTLISVYIECNQDSMQVSITNTGSFIEESMRDAVFDKFSGVQKSMKCIKGQNFGLGLTFSKMAVDAMSGKIWIEGDPAVPSTTFIFTVNYK
jgi:K+-sensing histidine kinase KdpD